MADRMNFTRAQRDSAFRENAAWLAQHRVDGIEIVLAYEHLRKAGLVYWCEHCLFCHVDREYFDVDHLVPDRAFRLWGQHQAARLPQNMMVLCKSRMRGELGCNQSKGARLWVPERRGLALTLPGVDLNFTPVRDRPAFEPRR